MDEINDEMLIQAMRKRLLDQIAAQGGGSQSVVNNVYGGGISEAQGAGGGPDPSDRDYFVDIMREDLPEINAATGKPKGWKKSVHRFSTEKKKNRLSQDPE